MARYYLIPNEAESANLKGMARAPKYRTLLGTARGVTDWNHATGRSYYLVIIENDSQDMTELEAKSDVRKIDINFKKAQLQALGISVTGTPTRDEIEQLLMNWLTGESRTFRTL